METEPNWTVLAELVEVCCSTYAECAGHEALGSDHGDFLWGLDLGPLV
jgi:hypothetical protein